MTDTAFLAERVDPKTTALIVVDVQNDFCHPPRCHYHGRSHARLACELATIMLQR